MVGRLSPKADKWESVVRLRRLGAFGKSRLQYNLSAFGEDYRRRTKPPLGILRFYEGRQCLEGGQTTPSGMSAFGAFEGNRQIWSKRWFVSTRVELVCLSCSGCVAR
jgi:hypothetical protein